MIQELQQIFHSITKSLELIYVAEGIKPCARILAFEDDLGKILNFINEKNLFACISDFKVLKQTVQSDFYSDISIKIPKEDKRKGYFFVYLSKNEAIAQKSKLLEENNKHKELGLMLGYPECCCEFFERNFDEDNADLTLKTLDKSQGYEFQFYNNIAARHFDVTLLSHFPHSFECEPSIRIAKERLKTIDKHSNQLSGLFSGILQSVVIYTANEGVFLLRKYEKVSNKIIYADVLTTTKSKLYYLLASHKELDIVNKNNFVVGVENISGEGYGVMIFT